MGSQSSSGNFRTHTFFLLGPSTSLCDSTCKVLSEVLASPTAWSPLATGTSAMSTRSTTPDKPSLELAGTLERMPSSCASHMSCAVMSIRYRRAWSGTKLGTSGSWYKVTAERSHLGSYCKRYIMGGQVVDASLFKADLSPISAKIWPLSQLRRSSKKQIDTFASHAWRFPATERGRARVFSTWAQGMWLWERYADSIVFPIKIRYQ